MQITLDEAVDKLRHAEYSEEEILDIVDVLGITEEIPLFDASSDGSFDSEPDWG